MIAADPTVQRHAISASVSDGRRNAARKPSSVGDDKNIFRFSLIRIPDEVSCRFAAANKTILTIRLTKLYTLFTCNSPPRCFPIKVERINISRRKIQMKFKYFSSLAIVMLTLSLAAFAKNNHSGKFSVAENVRVGSTTLAVEARPNRLPLEVHPRAPNHLHTLRALIEGAHVRVAEGCVHLEAAAARHAVVAAGLEEAGRGIAGGLPGLGAAAAS